MTHSTGLFCEQCGEGIPESKFRLKCPSCGGPLEVRYDLEQMKKALSDRPPKSGSGSLLKQWIDVLPIADPELIDRISIGETETPLLSSSKIGRQVGIEDLKFKVELGPTLSWKDRGTSLCMLKALELGYDTVCLPSSGNNAASAAAYAAKAGLSAVVFVKKDTPAAKILKIAACGAKVVRVDGDMAAGHRLCWEMLERHRWFHVGSPNPYRITAGRTVAYEVIFQMGGRVPDAVLFPVAAGAGMVAGYLGFLELFQMGLIPSMPRLVGVQLEACDPLTQAFNKGMNQFQPVAIKPSLSTSLMSSDPYWGIQALKAARETNGLFLSVTDEEFLHAIHLLATGEGLFVEPAGAASVAALGKLMAHEKLRNVKTVVCMLSGHGLNASLSFDSEKIPGPVKPEVAAVESYLGL